MATWQGGVRFPLPFLRGSWHAGRALCHSVGELAKALNAFVPTSFPAGSSRGLVLHGREQARGLTFHDFKRWYWPGGEKLISGKSSTMKKARPESPVLLALQEAQEIPV